LKKRSIIAAVMILLIAAALTACGSGSKSRSSALPGGQAALDSTVSDSTAADRSAAVVYFSGTGNTRAVAEKISRELGADLLEIVPAVSYSSADLDYSNSSCRANKEQKDTSARPEIKNDLSAVEKYDTVYLGYPIWWGTAPRIIDTFLEKYDLSGKTVFVFCTSASSGIDDSISDLQGVVSNLKITGGQRFKSDAAQSDVDKWLKGLQGSSETER